MISKKLIIIIAVLISILILCIIVVYGSNTSELIKKDQEYKRLLEEKNKELSLIDKIAALDTFKEKCIDVRNNPSDYYPEVVEKCK